MKVTIYAIAALLAVTFAHGLENRAAVPEALKLVARQDSASTTEAITSTSVLSKAPPTPAVATDVIDTILSKGPKESGVPSGVPSGAPTASAYAPAGTGSLIPSWSSLIAKGGVATSQPSSPPTPASTSKTAETPNSAHKFEVGLISSGLIAGIVSLFF